MATLQPASPPASGLLPTSRPPGQILSSPAGILGELVVSEALPQYYSLAKSGVVFSLAALGLATLTAFAGGAAGTPILGLYNPANSGKDLVLLLASLGIRTTGATAAALAFNWFGVNQGGVAVSGTQTPAANAYSQANTGSVAWGMVNTANTGALASTLRRSSFSVGNVTTTAGLNAASFIDDIKGALIISPGSYMAFGAANALATAGIDASIMWAEVPV